MNNEMVFFMFQYVITTHFAKVATDKTLILLIITILGSVSFAASNSPFRALAGWWSGSGHMVMANGTRESIKCRATYFISKSGLSLTQNLRCASRDIKIEAKSNLTYSNGRLSGAWNETTYNVGGNVSGSAKGKKFNVFISGNNFSGSMTLNVSGRHQSVILQPKGIDVKAIRIKLKKG